MTFEIEMNGRTRSVSIERAGAEGRFRGSVAGEATPVEAQRSGTFGLSLLFPEAGHQTARVSITPGPAQGELLAYLEGRTLSVAVNARRTGRGGADAAVRAHGEQRVTAPMPGRVVRVLVEAGDS